MPDQSLSRIAWALAIQVPPTTGTFGSARYSTAFSSVTPAAVRTEIFDQMTEQHIQYMLSKIPMGRFGLATEIAAMIAWLASEDCSFSTGATFDLSGGRAVF